MYNNYSALLAYSVIFTYNKIFNLSFKTWKGEKLHHVSKFSDIIKNIFGSFAWAVVIYDHHHLILIQVFLVTVNGLMHLISSAIAPTPSHHLVQFEACSISNPILFVFSSTCLLHLCLGFPRLRCPFISSINVLFRRLSLSLLITYPYHLATFDFAILFNVSFRPSIFIISFFLSTGDEIVILLNLRFKFNLKGKRFGYAAFFTSNRTLNEWF